MENTPNTELLATDWIDPSPERPPSPSRVLFFVRSAFRLLGPLAPRLAARLAFRFFTTPRFRARHSATDELLASAKDFDLFYEGYKLKGYAWGEGPRTILLIHGWESRGTALRTFVPPLLEQGFRVVAFDGPAHGDSEGKRTNILHFAGAVEAVIRQLGEVYGIIGHSFGGASALYALNHLDAGLELRKLVLIAVPADMVHILEEAVRTMGLPQSVAVHFRELLEEKAGKPLAELNSTLLENQLDACSILLVHDRHDRQVPVDSSLTMVREWANAQLVLTDGYGHYRLMKNPDLIRRVASFFSEVLITV